MRERDLIKAIRERGLLWRTEQSYRDWARRFVASMKAMSPDAAGETQIAAFLSELAVVQGVGASTQRQALSALVFSMRGRTYRSTPPTSLLLRVNGEGGLE